MLAIERRNEILERLQTEKRVLVSELSQFYKVSEETIRRDLEKLENDGLAIKSYGGAVLNEHSIFDLPFNIRKKKQVEEKQKIADLIADTVRDGEVVMLDASSTAVYVAKALLEKRKKLTVITNSVEIIVGLFDAPEWTVISTGGVSRERSFALHGPNTERIIRSYHVDKAIVSCKGMSLERGFMDSDEQDASCKRAMLQAASERILAVDSSKFGEVAFVQIAEWGDITRLVTDQKPSDQWLRELERMRIQCVYPSDGKNDPCR